MSKKVFKYINTFRVDFYSFRLFVNAEGEYKTVAKDLENGDAAPVETIYKDKQQLIECYEDDLTIKELFGKKHEE